MLLNEDKDTYYEQATKLLSAWHPGWVVALVVLAILAFRANKIVKAWRTCSNERLKILKKDERRRMKLRNARKDRQRKGE